MVISKLRGRLRDEGYSDDLIVRVLQHLINSGEIEMNQICIPLRVSDVDAAFDARLCHKGRC